MFEYRFYVIIYYHEDKQRNNRTENAKFGNKVEKVEKKGRSSGLTGREEEDQSHEQNQSLFTSNFFTFYVLGSGVSST